MKILLATYWAIPHVDGVWGYMNQLKSKLESLGHEVDLMGYGHDNSYVYIINKDRRITKDQLLPFLDTKSDIQSASTDYKNVLVNYTETQRHVYELAATYFGLEKYDVINTQDVISTACINKVRPKESVLVSTLHGCVSHEIKHQLTTIHKSQDADLAQNYFNNLEHIGATCAEVTVVPNSWLKNILMSEFNVAQDQIKLLHYGYDTESFLERMKEPCTIQHPANKRVILFMGRLVELKGVHHLIEALARLKNIRNDWVCWIVGEGEKEAQLKIQSKVLGLESEILFLVNRVDIPCLVANADIVVIPSLVENQPLAVIEAQIAGKPVIVSDAVGLLEIVENGVTGSIFPVGDTKELSKNLDVLLTDNTLRQKIGCNAQKWGLSHWNFDKAVQSLLKVYQEATLKKQIQLGYNNESKVVKNIE